MRYFRNSFIRYFAMALAFTVLSFLIGIFNANAESYSMPSYNFVMQYNYYDGSVERVATTSPTTTENGMSVFSNNTGNLTSYFNFRYIYNVSYSNVDLVTFNIRLYSGINQHSIVVDSVSAFDRPCYFVTSFSDDNSENTDFTTLSAICPIGSGSVNVSSSDYIIKVNTVYSTMPSMKLSNVGIIQSSIDSQAVINALSGLNYNLNLSNSKLDTLISALNGLSSQNATINQSIVDTKNAIDSQAESTRDTITNSDTTSSESTLSDVISDPTFADSSGVNAIINLPLEFINSLNSTCTPLVLNFPHFNNISIPCMSTIYQKFAPFDTILSLVINGFVIYRILIELFYIVKSSRDPDSDRVEVLDL